jgi:spore coat polysaccharide biosynthesis predicted glycosyltransferase SpsG
VTPRALLAADCGRGVGLGHLERMLALADALRPDVEVSVLIPGGDVALRRRVSDRGHIPVEARGDTSERVEAAVDACGSLDAIVLDGYVFDVGLQRRLRDRAPLTVVDDLRLPADCDLAVNPSPGGEALRPAGAETFFGGASYALIRASFLEARAVVGRRGRPPRTVLVSTGATALDNLGEHVTAELLESDATLAVIRVVGPDTHAGSGRHPQREQRLVSPANLAEALTRATVYVGAAGTTAVQAACVGVPAVITAAVPNQTAQASALAAARCAVVANLPDLATTCLQLLDDVARCEDMSARGRNLVDGQGAPRVAKAVHTLAGTGAA